MMDDLDGMTDKLKNIECLKKGSDRKMVCLYVSTKISMLWIEINLEKGSKILMKLKKNDEEKWKKEENE